MLLSPLPTWKDILGLGKEKDMSKLLSSGTAPSLSLIFEAYRDAYQKKSVTVLLPDYFCGETENILFDSNILVFRYPITESFEPDWQYIKERYSAAEVDFFLLVHYFGISTILVSLRTVLILYIPMGKWGLRETLFYLAHISSFLFRMVEL